MITQKTIFETSDGKQFETLFDAEHHELRAAIEAALSKGCYRDEFEMEEAITELLKHFNVTRKDDNATNL